LGGKKLWLEGILGLELRVVELKLIMDCSFFTSQRTLKNEYTVIKDRSKLLNEQVNYALHCHPKEET